MKIKPRLIQYPMKNWKNNCNSYTKGNKIFSNIIFAWLKMTRTIFIFFRELWKKLIRP
jgi:hypothetical protein